MRGTVVKLTRYPAKGAAGEVLSAGRFRAEMGLEGDRYWGRKNPISVLTQEARAWMKEQGETGLCFARFKENILLAGVDLSLSVPGSCLILGTDVLLEITEKKRCFPECELFSKNNPCLLAEHAVYAQVRRGGDVRPGDGVKIILEEKGNSVEQKLNHFDREGNAVMVDVSAKKETERQAVAKGRIRMKPETLKTVQEGSAKKGDVLGVARVAGIMAAKKTADLIPMCHLLMLEKCSVDFAVLEDSCEIEALCTVKTSGKTGVEMEALTGVTTALLTIYDMCKAMDRGMELHSICLWEKFGGKSGIYQRDSATEGEA